MTSFTVVTDATAFILLWRFSPDQLAWLRDANVRLVTPEVVTAELRGDGHRKKSTAPQRFDVVSLFDLWNVRVTPTEFSDMAAVKEFKKRHGLGSGESAVILLAQQTGLPVLTDDRRARRIAEELLGPERAISSIDVIWHAITQQTLSLRQLRGAVSRVIPFHAQAEEWAEKVEQWALAAGIPIW